MAQSSVEWLVERIKKDTNLRLRGFDIDGMAEQAKAMHKEEIKKALFFGYKIESPPINAKEYYNETYGNENKQTGNS